MSLQLSELKQLQSQINPHFLYNSFYNLYRMSKAGDSNTVAVLAQKLGSYYQYVTRDGASEVSLMQEYRHAMVYADIQSIRFSNRIQVVTEQPPPELEHVFIPRLVLQPVLENAFEHALEQQLAGGTLFISFDIGAEALYVVVEDNGII
ncbi:histidine kinase [Paenibacillus sp. MER TA 81-3]|uniref:sensor histidine kinase n=1 Tax=Paenibacillus sp. MER TA 81-3 TaxID=2939573 RepID=UPI00203DFFD8|nr:histidine kinase [Paenibacillus sp. MER TA 81-3]MCM3342154.1 histidine kinase [Paenibacillus sp. MER TA 81-3]